MSPEIQAVIDRGRQVLYGLMIARNKRRRDPTQIRTFFLDFATFQDILTDPATFTVQHGKVVTFMGATAYEMPRQKRKAWLVCDPGLADAYLGGESEGILEVSKEFHDITSWPI